MSGSLPSRGIDGADHADVPEGAQVLEELRTLLVDLRQRTGLPLSLDSDLSSDLGLDSLAVVELHDRLERKFGVRLSDDVLASAVTPNDWVDAVLAARGSLRLPVRSPERLGVEGRVEERWPSEPTTVLEALSWHVSAHGHRPTVRVIDEKGSVEEITYRSLATESLKVANALSSLGLRRGERVGLLLVTGADYFAIFLGVMLAGGVPMPLYPPTRRATIEEHLRRTSRLLMTGDSAMLICIPEARSFVRLLRSQVPSLRQVLTPEDLAGSGSPGAALPAMTSEEEALVQFTSGSTGDPKGVLLTHGQLIANIVAMAEAADADSSDLFVSWLPLYHDMGLIGAWLTPLVLGMPLVVLSPLSFLARPVVWLKAISDYRGTLSAAPNFAFASCTERIAVDELEGLDLSSWRLAFNGSEPVSPSVISRFFERFEPYGFRREALCPAYGLAEVGVGVAFSSPGRGPKIDTVDRAALEQFGQAVPVGSPSKGGRSIVSCGRALPGYRLRVVDENGVPFADRHEGCVECNGPSATSGYVGNEPASTAMWRNGWLDTGDLGYLADGELYLTGRRKDLVIRAGRNLHPEELEEAISALDGVEHGGVAVFGVDDLQSGTEALIVALETRVGDEDSRSTLRSSVSACVLEVVGVLPDRVETYLPSELPRTASGKVRRGATKDAYEQGLLGIGHATLAVQVARFLWSGRRLYKGKLREVLSSVARGISVWLAVVAIALPLLAALELPVSLRLRWQLARGAVRMLQALSGIRIDLTGGLPAMGPVVFAANHASFIDGALFLLASPRPFDFVASSDIEALPIFGCLLRRLGCTFVSRGRAERSEATLRTLEAILERDGRLLIFPEGSIAISAELRSFQLGAFVAAASTGSPVVPVAIRGSGSVLPAGTHLPRSGRIEVAVSGSCRVLGDDLSSAVELRDQVRRSIAELLGASS